MWRTISARLPGWRVQALALGLAHLALIGLLGSWELVALLAAPQVMALPLLAALSPRAAELVGWAVTAMEMSLGLWEPAPPWR